MSRVSSGAPSHASASEVPQSELEEGTSEPEDVEMKDEDEDDVPQVKPRKKKPRKVIPVGRNGLKKKRVVKSRMTVQDNGYMGLYLLIRLLV